MKNLNKIPVTILVLLLCFGAFAQRPAQNRIKTLKVAYITEQLGLSTDEAQQFWPIYNENEKDLEKIRVKERQQFGGVQRDMSVITDKEAETMVAAFLRLQAEKQALEEKFIAKLRGVIPAKKIILLFRAEKNFKKRLLQQYRERRGRG